MGKPAPTTSEVILAAAQRTIRGHGSEQFTLSAVAAEAGVSRPTLYRWFPTRSLLLGAVAAYEVEQFDIGLQALADEHRDPPRRLDAALRYLVNYLEETVGSDSIQVDPAFALQGLADSLPPHIESVARVLGDALDELPSVRDGIAHSRAGGGDLPAAGILSLPRPSSRRRGAPLDHAHLCRTPETATEPRDRREGSRVTSASARTSARARRRCADRCRRRGVANRRPDRARGIRCSPSSLTTRGNCLVCRR